MFEYFHYLYLPLLLFLLVWTLCYSNVILQISWGLLHMNSLMAIMRKRRFSLIWYRNLPPLSSYICCVITQWIDHCLNNSQLCNILMANNRKTVSGKMVLYADLKFLLCYKYTIAWNNVPEVLLSMYIQFMVLPHPLHLLR